MAFLVWYHWYDPFPSSSRDEDRGVVVAHPPFSPESIPLRNLFGRSCRERDERGQEGERARASTLGGQELMTLAKCSDISSSIQLISSLICSWGNSSLALTVDVIYTCPLGKLEEEEGRGRKHQHFEEEEEEEEMKRGATTRDRRTDARRDSE